VGGNDGPLAAIATAYGVKRDAREAMVMMVEVYEGDRQSAEGVVDVVLGDLAAKLRESDG
jgi:hypothetical protein